MRGARVAMGASLGALVLGLVALGQAADSDVKADDVSVTDHDRLWENFQRETAVVDSGQFRLELQGMTLNASRNPPLPPENGSPAQTIIRGTPAGNVNIPGAGNNLETSSGGNVGLIASYGLFDHTEVGAHIQGVFQGLRFFNTNDPTTTVGGQVFNANTFGDMWLYGKYKYNFDDNLGIGGGVELRLPTGSRSKFTGTGEVGTNPFISTRYTQGRWAVGGNVGYQFNSGDLDGMFNWSADGIVQAGKIWAIRAEFTGWNYSYGAEKINNAYCSPGIDFNFSQNITIRPQGQVGLSKSAMGWGLGVGMAYTF